MLVAISVLSVDKRGQTGTEPFAVSLVKNTELGKSSRLLTAPVTEMLQWKGQKKEKTFP